MAFFDNSYSSECAYGTVATEAYDADFGGLDNILAECYEDELSVIKSIHAIDMAEIGARKRGVTESAELAVAMEGAIGDFFSNIKDKLKKFFAKIGAWFKSLFEKMFVFSKSNKSFAETYKKQLEEVSSYVTTVKYTGYAWKHDQMTDGDKSKMNQVIADIEKYSENLQTIVERAIERAQAAHDGSDAKQESLKLDDETKAAELNAVRTINKYYRDGGKDGASGVRAAVISSYRNGDSKTEQTYDMAMILRALDNLTTIDEKPFKKAHSIVSKNFDKALKVIDRAEKAATAIETAKDDDAAAAKKTVLVKAIRDLNTTHTKNKQTALNIVSAEKTVATEYAAEIKSVTIKAIAEGKAKKKEADKKKK